MREVPDGVQSEVIFVFDLELPRYFDPHNQDGEVAELQRMPIVRVQRMMDRRGEITLDASMDIMRFLERLK